MNWFIYWATGSCNDGSCEYGFEAFATDFEAEKRFEELKRKHGRPVYDFTVKIVHGTDVSRMMGL